jgi:SPP1 family predicted phage head-tail adaptor
MTAQQTEIGDLNRRVVLLAPVESDDGEGGVARSYSAVTTLWAQIVAQNFPLTARTDTSADSLGAALRYRIVLRYRDDVTTHHQLQEGGDIYRVIAARASADRRFLEIDAELRED